MKRLLCLVLMCATMGSPLTAAGPILTSAMAIAEQQPARARPPRQNPEMYWSGVLMSGMGGFMLGWGLGTEQTVTCFAFGSVVSCEETGGNRNALIGVGAALMGTGIMMSVIGGKRVAVTPTRRGIRIGSRVGW